MWVFSIQHCMPVPSLHFSIQLCKPFSFSDLHVVILDHVIFWTCQDLMILIFNICPRKDTWTLADWPVLSPEAEDAKQDMLNTHRVVPLPAYDIKGNLIEPRIPWGSRRRPRSCKFHPALLVHSIQQRSIQFLRGHHQSNQGFEWSCRA